jgi:YidC/Oxa1 family membrane protein insertase
VRSWVLGYHGTKPLAVGGSVGPLAVGVSRPGVDGVEVVPLRPRRSEVTVQAAGEPGSLEFSGTAANGLRIWKRLEFRGDTYEVAARIGVDGPSAAGTHVLLYWTSPVLVPGSKQGDAGVTFGETSDHRQLLGRLLVGYRGRDPEVFDAPSPALREPQAASGGHELKDPHLVAPDVRDGAVSWVALEDDYFIAALATGGVAEGLRGRTRERAEAAVVFPEIGRGGTWEAGTRLYVGPKEWTRLAALGIGLEAAQGLNYGHFLRLPFIPMWWFCVPLLWLLNFFGTHVPGQNYGVAIILLTVLVKGVFYPLAQKSMRSMKQMQALQPQLNALKAKYRSDPQRFQREQMELFRRHKVNPMGGCLPMVVQIPIFYALYLTLQYSVELQGAPFFWWIHDLSKKDPYYVLPILMGLSMLVQQKMTPTVGDPRQAQVMMVMPVIFTFMFLEFPTGLVLYWLVNNVLSVLQQYLIDRAVARSAAAAG